MDSSMLIGILIGVIVVLAFLAFRKKGSGTSTGSGASSTPSAPTVRRVEEPPATMVDKRAAKAAAIKEREQLAPKRTPKRTRASVKQASSAKRMMSKTAVKKAAAAKTPDSTTPATKSVKKKHASRKSPVRNVSSEDLPRKSGKKTSSKASRDVASGDSENTKPRNMID